MDARSQRIAVVGQISLSPEKWSDPKARRTVVLGPFSVRGIPDTQDKFERATESGSAAREAGYGLAWDTKTGLGRGRFTLAPVFYSARDAWNYWRPELGPLREVVEGAFSRRKEMSGNAPPCHCGYYDPRACPEHGGK